MATDRIFTFTMASLALGAVLGGAAPASAGDPNVHDEWDANSGGVIVETTPGDKLSPVAAADANAAIAGGLPVTVVDGDAATQSEVKAQLGGRNLVTTTDTPHTTGWGRDEAPITVYDAAGNASLISTAHDEDTAITSKIGDDVARATGLNYLGIAQVIGPDGKSSPLFLDGGDFMTTNGGKTLLTTTNLYSNNGEGTENKEVNASLNSNFGIETVVPLQPLDQTAAGYNLSNAHVDLEVRTLPNNNVIVATVPVDDPQFPIVQANIDTLMVSGFNVIQVQNAPKDPANSQDTGFKSYTNALFLNKTVLIPSYGDPASDQAARDAYDKALNDSLPPNDPRRFKIVQVDSKEAAHNCGATRCGAMQIGLLPSVPVGTEASSKNNPSVAFDAASDSLTLTKGRINFLGKPGADQPDPAYAGDSFLGATLEVDGLRLDQTMSEKGQYAFVGGKLSVKVGTESLLSADITVLSILCDAPRGAVRRYGVLNNIDEAPGNSQWLDDFMQTVVGTRPYLPDFFMSSPVDLIALSDGFTTSFGAVELDRMGLIGNGPAPIPELGTISMLMFGFGCLGGLRFRARQTACLQ